MIGYVAAGYSCGAAGVWLIYGAWQRATLDGPAFKTRRKHVAECGFCEEPGWFWATGYQCGRGNYGSAYPLSLSPWSRLLVSAFWFGAWIAPLCTFATRRLARLFARAIKERHQSERDRRDVERLMKELDGVR